MDADAIDFSNKLIDKLSTNTENISDEEFSALVTQAAILAATLDKSSWMSGLKQSEQHYSAYENGLVNNTVWLLVTTIENTTKLRELADNPLEGNVIVNSVNQISPLYKQFRNLFKTQDPDRITKGATILRLIREQLKLAALTYTQLVTDCNITTLELAEALYRKKYAAHVLLLCQLAYDEATKDQGQGIGYDCSPAFEEKFHQYVALMNARSENMSRQDEYLKNLISVFGEMVYISHRDEEEYVSLELDDALMSNFVGEEALLDLVGTEIGKMLIRQHSPQDEIVVTIPATEQFGGEEQDVFDMDVKNPTLVLYCANWCPYSKKIFPEWERFVQAAPHLCPELQLVKFDVGKNNIYTAFAKSQGVPSFPTLVLYYNGKISRKVGGSTTCHDMEKFVAHALR